MLAKDYNYQNGVSFCYDCCFDWGGNKYSVLLWKGMKCKNQMKVRLAVKIASYFCISQIPANKNCFHCYPFYSTIYFLFMLNFNLKYHVIVR